MDWFTLASFEGTEERFSAPRDAWLAGLVTRVVDGDTVDLCVQLPCVRHALVYRARLLGINAPETHTRNAEEKSAGLASADFLRNLVEGRKVCAHVQGDDMYGRLLVHLFLPDQNALQTNALTYPLYYLLHRYLGVSWLITSEQMLHVNGAMIEQGHAVEYDGKGKRAAFVSSQRDN